MIIPALVLFNTVSTRRFGPGKAKKLKYQVMTIPHPLPELKEVNKRMFENMLIRNLKNCIVAILENEL